VPPTDDDIARRVDELINPKTPDSIEVPTTADLQGQLSSALSTFLPKPASFLNNKEKLYSSFTSLMSKDRYPADIVLPVYNSVHVVDKCIKAVIARTRWPYRLIIVDDASDIMTQTVLKSYADKYPERITVLTNSKNKGFAATVNKGIAAGKGKYVFLLNSDVIVTQDWLTKLILALEADPRNQIVNPVTNNTALINVPMSPGASYLDMNRIIQNKGEVQYPEIMPTGFCYGFRRSLLSEIGPFDESYPNFGEESDHWMKTITYQRGPMVKGYRAIMADDTYVFHERGTSFASLGEEKHMGFRKQAADRFNRVWPQFGQWKKTFHIDKALGHINPPVPTSVLNSHRKVPYRICWVVRSAAFCGGMKFITDIVNEINERGGDARVAVVARDSRAKLPEPLGELRAGVINFSSEEEFLNTFTSKVFKNGVVVSSTSELAPLVGKLCEVEKKLKHVLHVQSYEPYLLEDEIAKKEFKKFFKIAPDVISSSHWITQLLTEEGINVLATISPGVDRKLFYPGNRVGGDDRLTVMLPMSPTYAFKGYDRGIGLIQHLYNKAIKAGASIRILTYGADSIPEVCGTAIALGPIPQTRLANVLRNEVDVFIDPSYNHSYGMPCLEAMASGAAVICWDNKGIGEYVRHGKNGLKLPNSMPAVEAAASVLSLLLNPEQREKLRSNALGSLTEHDRENSVNSFIEAMEKHLHLRQTKRRIVFVTPHMRKHGGPTTILTTANELAARGHDVSITSVYADISPEVLSFTDLSINLDHKDIPECDVLVVNSDNPLNNYFAELPQAKKKILLKLSHNARFKEYEEASLNIGWDKVVTSTEWLANVCRNPLPDWNNKPVDVTRVGWFHYGHESFAVPPSRKVYRGGRVDGPVRICTLVHQYPMKGSGDAIIALTKIKERFGDMVKIEGVGEYPKDRLLMPTWIKYHESLSRQQMADLFKNTDIWVGASHTEGLGRMALEAMSASIACVLTDVHTEFTEHDKNCLLVPIMRPDLICSALNSLIVEPAKMVRLGFEGHRTAEQRVDPTEHIDAMERVIEEAMA